MTNREKYKQAFSAIRASDNFSLEAEKMDFGTAFGLLWDALTGCES